MPSSPDHPSLGSLLTRSERQSDHTKHTNRHTHNARIGTSSAVSHHGTFGPASTCRSRRRARPSFAAATDSTCSRRRSRRRCSTEPPAPASSWTTSCPLGDLFKMDENTAVRGHLRYSLPASRPAAGDSNFASCTRTHPATFSWYRQSWADSCDSFPPARWCRRRRPALRLLPPRHRAATGDRKAAAGTEAEPDGTWTGAAATGSAAAGAEVESAAAVWGAAAGPCS